eukprot:jgi/Ulvmu1/7634/UM038_0061.1
MSKYAHIVPEEGRAVVTWQGLSVAATKKLKEDKVILDNVTGKVEPGHMLAIMGPSGSGKTTLLDTLAGRAQGNLHVQGDVRVNGHHTKMSYGTVAYVPQQDLLTGTLTVYETLMFAAKLRLAIPQHERAELVDAILHELGLASAASTPVGTLFIKGVSGGQKRRLSIACEVLVSPAILFLDEPTSGLDSASAFFCIKALKVLANQSRTIIMSIHQPSAEVFDVFDRLLLLSQGQMVFFGEAARAGQFYSDAGLPCPVNRAMADHFLFCMNTDFKRVAQDFTDVPEAEKDIDGFLPYLPGGAATKLTRGASVTDADQSIVTLRDAFEKHQRAALEQEVRASVDARGPQHEGICNPVNPLSQLFTLVHRTFLNSTRDIGVFWLRLGMYVGLSFCLGTIYFQLGEGWNEVTSRGGLMFFTISFLTFMAISGFPSFVDEMQVFVRERLNGYYGVLPYTLANTIASLPFLALIAVACSVVVYYLAGLVSDGGRVAYFILNLFTCLVTVEALMMAIAAIVPHYLLGIAGGAALLGIFMPVAGYIIAIDDIPKPMWRYPMHYIGYHTYGIHGMMLNQFEDTAGWDCPCTLQPGGCPEENCTVDGEAVLEALNWSTARTKWEDLAVMCIMIVVYRAGFFGMLKLREALSK